MPTDPQHDGRAIIAPGLSRARTRPPSALRATPSPLPGTTQASRPDQLTARVFRALYPGYDLLTFGVLHVVTPKGTPVLTGESLGHIARQIAGHQTHGGDPDDGQPHRHDPDSDEQPGEPLAGARRDTARP